MSRTEVVISPLNLKKAELLEIKEPSVFKNSICELSFDDMKQLKYDLKFRDKLSREFDREIEFAYDVIKAKIDRARQDKQTEDLLNAATWKGATAGGVVGFSVSGLTSLWYGLTLLKGLLISAGGGFTGSLAGGFWAHREAKKTINNGIKQSVTPSAGR